MEKKFVKNSLIIIFLYGITKIAGFAKEMLLANYYGASEITDAYNLVVTMSATFFEGITTAVVVGYLVIIAKEKSDEKINEITSQVISIVATLVFAISVVATIFAHQTCSVLAIGFNDSTMEITVKMARVILPFSALYVSKNIIGGYLQNKQSFWFTGARNLIMNFVLIISIILSKGNIYVLAFGYSCATLVVWGWGSVEARRQGLRIRYTLGWNNTLQMILKMAIPVFVTQLIVELNLIIDRNFASILGTGMVSLFNYANKVYILFVAIFAQAFATAIFPDLSAIGSDNKKEYNKIVRQALEIICLVMIPLAMFVGFKAQDIVEVIFMRGAFQQSDADITAKILSVYAMAIPAVSLNEMYNKCFYAIKKTKQPILASVVALLINVVGNFVFINYFGYIGLAIATVVSTWVLVFVQAYLFEKINIIEKANNGKTYFKILIASFVGVLGIAFFDICFNMLEGGINITIIKLMVEFIVMCVLHILIAKMLAVSYVADVINILKKLLNKFKKRKCE